MKHQAAQEPVKGIALRRVDRISHSPTAQMQLKQHLLKTSILLVLSCHIW